MEASSWAFLAHTESCKIKLRSTAEATRATTIFASHTCRVAKWKMAGGIVYISVVRWTSEALRACSSKAIIAKIVAFKAVRVRDLIVEGVIESERTLNKLQDMLEGKLIEIPN